MSEYYKADGIIKLDYKGRVIQVPFAINLIGGYGGRPVVKITDKYGDRYSFIRDSNEWRPYGEGLKCPKMFLALMYEAFENEFQNLSKRVRSRGKECSCPVCREKRDNAKQ